MAGVKRKSIKTKARGKKGKKGSKKKKTPKKVKAPVNVIGTVIPVSTPVGSVHFDEFLKICLAPPKPVEQPVVEAPKPKGKKKAKGKRGAKGKKKGKAAKKSAKGKKKGAKGKKKGAKGNKKEAVAKPVEAPPVEEPNDYPPLFPLIQALLLPAEGDALDESVLFSDFVVGKNEPPLLKRQTSMREVNLIEKQANDTVDEILKVQENIKLLMQKSKLSEAETVESENQQQLLMNLLSDFENCLERIRDILHREQAETHHDEDEDEQWVDVEEDEETEQDKRRLKCDDVEDYMTNRAKSLQNMNEGKWYEGTDLAYLLSPSTSFDKGADMSVSSGVMKIFDQLKQNAGAARVNVKRNDVFKRLKAKFSVLLPPPKTDGTRKNLIWMDQKLHRDHQAMLEGTKNLKLFQCWNQLEVKYNIVNALIISLKDAIKSTSPFFYGTKESKEEFVGDQGALVQSLDQFMRMAKRAFSRAGLEDYWKVHPESIRLGSKPCFEVTLQQLRAEYDQPVEPPEFLQRNPFITKNDNCKNVVKIVNSEDSEVEVDTFNYKDAFENQ